MKKFVICNNRCGIMLSEEHLAWLYGNGYNDADIDFCHNDRSNPALIACIEAVRAQKQHAVEEGQRLWDAMRDAQSACNEFNSELAKQIDALLEMLDFNPHWKNRIIRDVRCVINGAEIVKMHPCAYPKSGISSDAVKECLNIIVEMGKNDPKLIAAKKASESFHNHITENGLCVGRREQIQVNDGFDIETYDETKFVASVCCNYADRWEEEDYERMSLKPYLSHSTLASFVDAGDADGLFDFLKSLNVGNFMDIRDDRANRPNNNSDVSMADEEVARLLAEFEALASNKA